jgi:hypothetical protein
MKSLTKRENTKQYANAITTLEKGIGVNPGIPNTEIIEEKKISIIIDNNVHCLLRWIR